MVGYITPIVGDSELLRDWLVDNGAKWSRNWGWYFEGEAPTLPIGLTASSPIHWEELQKKEATGEFIGTIGERRFLTGRHIAAYKTKTGKMCYHFQEPVTNNIVIWFTTPRELEINKLYDITGTVKQHQIFRDQRQTVLTRCKIEPINL